MGLLGEFKMISRVRWLISRSKASRSKEKPFSSSRGTAIGTPPATLIMAS